MKYTDPFPYIEGLLWIIEELDKYKITKLFKLDKEFGEGVKNLTQISTIFFVTFFVNT